MSQTNAPGAARRPTLEDVAAQAGVSRALVSIVMREAPGASAETRTRVQAVAEGLGYRPDRRARLLARQRTRLLGVTMQPGHPFHADLVTGLYSAAERHGYELVLSATTPRRDAGRAVETLLDYRCEGLVLLTPEVAATRLAALARTVAVVVVGREVRQAVDVVRTADAQGVEQAVDHLCALGHLEIAHVDGARAASSGQRRRGYRSAMARRGLAGLSRVVTGGQTEEDGARAGRVLLAEGLPTAVVCYNDRCAVGMLDVLIRSGVSVPGQVSVVGYDDSQLARLSHINLTSVAQDVDRMAELAVQRLVARIEGHPREVGTAAQETVLPPRLVVRTSTGPVQGR